MGDFPPTPGHGSRRASGWLAVVLATAVFHTSLLAAYVLAYGGDVSALMCANASRIGVWPFEEVRVGFPSGGFDGQFYYVLARDPWRPHDAVIDLAPYRHVRILYPALAWLLTGGDPYWLLWAMPAINLFAISAAAGLGAGLAAHYGRSRWCGFLLPVVLNSGMAALRDLTDPLSTMTACGLVTAWLLRWPVLSLAAWAVAAVLSREQNAVIVLIVLVDALARQFRLKAFGLMIGLLVGLSWVVTIWSMYSAWPVAPGNLGPPFAGMWYRWTHLAGLSGPRTAPIHAAGMLLLSAQVALSLALVWFRADRIPIMIALSGAALAVMGGQGIYENGWSYPRVFVWMPLGIWLWAVQSGRRWPTIVLASAVMWPLFAILQAWLR